MLRYGNISEVATVVFVENPEGNIDIMLEPKPAVTR